MTLRNWYIVFVSSMEQIIGAALSTVVSIIIPLLNMLLHPELSSIEQGIMGAAGLVGIAVGSIVIGPLTDRYGYLKWFRACAVIIVVGGLLALVFANAWTICTGLFVAGFGVGGGYTLDANYISEVVPPQQRNNMVGVAKATCAIGFLLPVALAVPLLHAYPSPQAWRAMLWMLVALGVVTMLMRMRWAESPRWLAQKGYTDRAAQAAAFFRIPASTPSPTVPSPLAAPSAGTSPLAAPSAGTSPLAAPSASTPPDDATSYAETHLAAPSDGTTPIVAPSAVPSPEDATSDCTVAQANHKASIGDMFTGRNLLKVIYSGIPWACEGLGVYGIGVFLPVLIMALGLSLNADPATATTVGALNSHTATLSSSIMRVTDSIELSAIINFCILPGFIIGLLVVNRINNYFMLWTGFLGSAIGLILLLVAYVYHLPLWVSIVAFVVFEICLNGGPHLVTFIIPVMIYPVAVRGTGAGIADFLGKVGAIVGVFAMPILLKIGGIDLVLYVTIATMLVGSLIAVLTGRLLGLRPFSPHP